MAQIAAAPTMGLVFQRASVKTGLLMEQGISTGVENHYYPLCLHFTRLKTFDGLLDSVQYFMGSSHRALITAFVNLRVRIQLSYIVYLVRSRHCHLMFYDEEKFSFPIHVQTCVRTSFFCRSEVYIQKYCGGRVHHHNPVS